MCNERFSFLGTDEEFQTPRGSLHFRKSSFDQSVNSPLFLGFSSVEKVKKRSFIFKKHSDSKIIGSTLINSNVSCTSPHKLPVVQEDDSKFFLLDFEAFYVPPNMYFTYYEVLPYLF